MAPSLLRLPLSVTALVVTGTWLRPPGQPLLWVAVALGHLIGRWIFARINPARYEWAVLAAMVAAAVAAIAAAVG